MDLKMRDPISALSHYAGALAALFGLLALIWRNPGDPLWLFSVLVYGTSLILLFSASAVYHTVIASPATVQVLRKLDHSAIYLLIAGSYTPFCVNAFTGFWQWGFLAVIWSLAVIGIVLKIFFIHTPRWLTAGVYVVMGWLSVFALQEMAALPEPAVFWLVAGGLIYTLGAVIYITKRLDFIPGRLGFHEIWHFFVLLGAASHFVAIASLTL